MSNHHLNMSTGTSELGESTFLIDHKTDASSTCYLSGSDLFAYQAFYSINYVIFGVSCMRAVCAAIYMT